MLCSRYHLTRAPTLPRSRYFVAIQHWLSLVTGQKNEASAWGKSLFKFFNKMYLPWQISSSEVVARKPNKTGLRKAV